MHYYDLMTGIKPRVLRDESRDLNAISDGKETDSSDALGEYYESHKDEIEDQEVYVKKRGIVKA
jgi:hypothetical protein